MHNPDYTIKAIADYMRILWRVRNPFENPDILDNPTDMSWFGEDLLMSVILDSATVSEALGFIGYEGGYSLFVETFTRWMKEDLPRVCRQLAAIHPTGICTDDFKEAELGCNNQTMKSLLENFGFPRSTARDLISKTNLASSGINAEELLILDRQLGGLANESKLIDDSPYNYYFDWVIKNAVRKGAPGVPWKSGPIKQLFLTASKNYFSTGKKVRDVFLDHWITDCCLQLSTQSNSPLYEHELIRAYFQGTKLHKAFQIHKSKALKVGITSESITIDQLSEFIYGRLPFYLKVLDSFFHEDQVTSTIHPGRLRLLMYQPIFC